MKDTKHVLPNGITPFGLFITLDASGVSTFDEYMTKYYPLLVTLKPDFELQSFLRSNSPSQAHFDAKSLYHSREATINRMLVVRFALAEYVKDHPHVVGNSKNTNLAAQGIEYLPENFFEKPLSAKTIAEVYRVSKSDKTLMPTGWLQARLVKKMAKKPAEHSSSRSKRLYDAFNEVYDDDDDDDDDDDEPMLVGDEAMAPKPKRAARFGMGTEPTFAAMCVTSPLKV